MKQIVLAAGLSLAALSSWASSDNAVSFQLDSLGAGVEITHAVKPGLNATLGYYGYEQKAANANSGLGNPTFSGLSSYFALAEKSRSFKLLADWYPFDDNQFRARAGLLHRNYQGKLKKYTYPPGVTSNSAANAVFDTFLYIITLGAYGKWDDPNKYAHTGEYTYDVSMAATLPYLGLGWGNPVKQAGGWGFTVDAGAYYLKPARMNIATQFACAAGTAAGTCTALQDASASAGAMLRSDMNNWDWTLAVGVSYNF